MQEFRNFNRVCTIILFRLDEKKNEASKAALICVCEGGGRARLRCAGEKSHRLSEAKEKKKCVKSLNIFSLFYDFPFPGIANNLYSEYLFFIYSPPEPSVSIILQTHSIVHIEILI
uniref:(northern house mosquito) hypothetical protein n=1 Tax=Culex pipiens TaxID=7175 RepID=A0A8D8IB21_CULPI